MLVVMVTVNALANILPINNQTTGAISDSFPIYFVPAGYVFSIWGIIYLLLIGFTIYQLLPKKQMNQLLDRVGQLFILGSIANTVWILLWHYNHPVLSVAAMVILLVTLILSYLRIKNESTYPSLSEKIFLHIPFSVYIGWISVATIANISVAFYVLSWGALGISGQVWTAILLFVVGILTSTMLVKHRDYAYYLVIFWATVGIYAKFSTEFPIAISVMIINTWLFLLACYLYVIKDRHLIS